MTDIVVRVMDCHICSLSSGHPEFLLLKRADDQIYPGIWQCVTGKIRENERPYMTALRETTEETGLAAEKLWVIDQVTHYYEAGEDRMNLIPVFGAVTGSKNVRLSKEHAEFRWCAIDIAEHLLLWDQQKSGVRKFYTMLIDEKLKQTFTEVDLETGNQTLYHP